MKFLAPAEQLCIRIPLIKLCKVNDWALTVNWSYYFKACFPYLWGQPFLRNSWLSGAWLAVKTLRPRAYLSASKVILGSSTEGAWGLSPRWGSARVNSLNFSRKPFKLGTANGTLINFHGFLPMVQSGTTKFGLVTWKIIFRKK